MGLMKDPMTTIPDIIRNAVDHPILPALAPPALDQFLTVFPDEHTLLFMVEFSVADQRWEYHFSMARARGQREPAVGLTVGLLVGFMTALGVPDKFVMSDNVVHIHWPKEDESDGPTEPARTH